MHQFHQVIGTTEQTSMPRYTIQLSGSLIVHAPMYEGVAEKGVDFGGCNAAFVVKTQGVVSQAVGANFVVGLFQETLPFHARNPPHHGGVQHVVQIAVHIALFGFDGRFFDGFKNTLLVVFAQVEVLGELNRIFF